MVPWTSDLLAVGAGRLICSNQSTSSSLEVDLVTWAVDSPAKQRGSISVDVEEGEEEDEGEDEGEGEEEAMKEKKRKKKDFIIRKRNPLPLLKALSCERVTAANCASLLAHATVIKCLIS